MFTPASEVVKKLLESYGIREENYSIYDIWNKELGKLSKKIRMMGVKGTTIMVEADHAAYKQEVRIRKKEFLKKINGHFGRIVVEDIKII
ncbi:MAG: hypothetical protein A2297_10130 [Elusimicrobia bacterium RIFOXYB2_FULL_48_7]|nr:MAG: hypothetical protein A2297_10130 [Elusimicrobia bacterium RIFOXYB2_FULL_48_7]